MIDVPAGHLYLGERIEPSSRKRDGRAMLLDAADLTTHGVVVGMTGSGKTGAAGRPAHAGPRPQGRSREPAAHVPRSVARGLAPWVEGGDPAAVAKDWAAGLSRWGIGPERIAALQDAR